MVGLAAYAVMRVSSRLSHTRARAVYDLFEAVDYVAERLPDALSAKLSYDDVQEILLWRLDHLRLRGSATYGRGDVTATEAEGRDEEVVTSDDDSVDYVLAQASESDRDIDALDVVVVLDLESQYLKAIGALGPPAEESE
ncbi:MAG: hypothetical protein F4Y28_11625 [Acidimicrobiia bacterium]|nr:hypothetical protein [Acidimicrobiia bacterium]MYG59851.1 hypothetical protein [Acidimicrobiia bacterium]MYJ32586.1 hypothetical protein [Acidimicrobiia bacterium]